jgi:hypothetical protein
MMDETGASIESVPVLLDAIRQLAPHFSAQPEVHHAAMSAMLKNYMERTQELRIQPNASVMRPVLDVLVSRTGAAPGAVPTVTMPED